MFFVVRRVDGRLAVIPSSECGIEIDDEVDSQLGS